MEVLYLPIFDNGLMLSCRDENQLPANPATDVIFVSLSEFVHQMLSAFQLVTANAFCVPASVRIDTSHTANPVFERYVRLT